MNKGLLIYSAVLTVSLLYWAIIYLKRDRNIKKKYKNLSLLIEDRAKNGVILADWEIFDQLWDKPPRKGKESIITIRSYQGYRLDQEVKEKIRTHTNALVKDEAIAYLNKLKAIHHDLSLIIKSDYTIICSNVGLVVLNTGIFTKNIINQKENTWYLEGIDGSLESRENHLARLDKEMKKIIHNANFQGQEKRIMAVLVVSEPYNDLLIDRNPANMANKEAVFSINDLENYKKTIFDKIRALAKEVEASADYKLAITRPENLTDCLDSFFEGSPIISKKAMLDIHEAVALDKKRVISS